MQGSTFLKPFVKRIWAAGLLMSMVAAPSFAAEKVNLRKMRSAYAGAINALKKAEAARESGRNDVIKIWSRRSTILPQFVGLTFGVYNGHKHIPVNVTEEMIGQKFGEYSPTRTYYGHAADKKAKRK